MREIGAKVRPLWVDLDRAHGISRRGVGAKVQTLEVDLEYEGDRGKGSTFMGNLRAGTWH